MHAAADQYVREHAASLNRPGISVLELGGRYINGGVRRYFDQAAEYVSVDIVPGRDVDVVADAADLELGRTFDVVVSTELLEHTPRAAEIVVTACRHLAPGGVFLATMAGPGRAPHSAAGKQRMEPDEWYRNIEPAELDEWLQWAGFDDWTVDVLGDDVRCYATVKMLDGTRIGTPLPHGVVREQSGPTLYPGQTGVLTDG